MGSRLLAMLLVAMLLDGCRRIEDTQKHEQSAAPPSAAAKQPATSPAQEQAESATAEPGSRLTDDFGLPLVIVIEKIEVPPEIQGPSPPIKK
jgi:hypothetical protein